MDTQLSPDHIELLQTEPVDFIELAFNDELWSKERDIAHSVRDSKYTGVRHCHGSGKSFTAARIALWFLYAFPDSKVITTAPTFRQVEDILWREIRQAKSKAIIQLGGKLNNTSLDLSEQWFAMGLSTDEPGRFQGYHAIHILLIVDEASGVTEDIFNASEGIVASQHARVLYIGNPTNTAGPFHKAFAIPGYAKIHISAFDTPNFTTFGITIEDIRSNTWQEKITSDLPRPYLITPEWVYDKYLRWGEGNPMWDSRVMGEFPEQGEDTLIPLRFIESARNRTLVPLPTDPEQTGHDVARFGSDKTEFCYRKGPKVLDWQTYNHMDTMMTSQKIRDFVTLYPSADVGIDEIGVGAGVYDRILQLLPDRKTFGVNVGLPAFDTEHFANLRAEIFWALRERFIEGMIDLSELSQDVYDDLSAQLSGLKFQYTTKGQIKIESKDDMKKRGLPSPDKADALAIAFGRLKNVVHFVLLDSPPTTQSLPAASPTVLTDEEERKKLELQAGHSRSCGGNVGGSDSAMTVQRWTHYEEGVVGMAKKQTKKKSASKKGPVSPKLTAQIKKLVRKFMKNAPRRAKKPKKAVKS